MADNFINHNFIDNFSRRQFLGTGGIGLLGAFTLRAGTWSSQPRERTLYVGTYTSGKSEGIYGYRMDHATGALTRFNSFKSVNPSFLAIDRNKRYLYAVNEVSDYAGKPSGGVSAFAIDRASGNLRLLNEQATQGADPCHLVIDRKNHTLLVANYTGGSVAVLPIRSDGTLAPSIDLKQHEGSGVKEQQKGPHAHCIILDRLERHALAADLGIDKVMIYRFDASTGKLAPANQPWAEVQAGAGPRHLTLHPNGKYVYVINELDSTLTVLKYNEVNGALSQIETVSTLPGDFSGASYCADVHVSPSGKFLYGSNRGHDSIVVFEIDPRTGKLKLIEHVSTEGKWPRNFTIDPTGRFLLVANQQTDNVVTFSIDSHTGRLKSTGNIEEIPSPVCLKFL
ncbi:MAG TPA: lactonase family protein [Pyrinomonadaceae bacterium]|nr:lactonase family protein [Pyrinomonadaceae bacterium]